MYLWRKNGQDQTQGFIKEWTSPKEMLRAITLQLEETGNQRSHQDVKSPSCLHISICSTGRDGSSPTMLQTPLSLCPSPSPAPLPQPSETPHGSRERSLQAKSLCQAGRSLSRGQPGAGNRFSFTYKFCRPKLSEPEQIICK